MTNEGNTSRVIEGVQPGVELAFHEDDQGRFTMALVFPEPTLREGNTTARSRRVDILLSLDNLGEIIDAVKDVLYADRAEPSSVKDPGEDTEECCGTSTDSENVLHPDSRFKELVKEALREKERDDRQYLYELRVRMGEFGVGPYAMNPVPPGYRY